MTAESHPAPISRTLLAAGALACALALAACSSSSAASGGGATSPAATGSSSAATPANADGSRGPAASGTVAAISGRTMQVQNQQTGQVAVTWTASTKFSHQVAVKVSAIKVGACVIAIGGSGTTNTTTSFTATSLIVSTARNGSCTGGFGGNRPGQRPSGAPSGFPAGARPSGFPAGARPSGFPARAGGSGAPSGARRIGAIASGKVTGINGPTLTIAAMSFGPSGPTSKTVTANGSTKITTEAATTSSSIAVGKCVTVEGKADSSGAVTATSVQITAPTNGQCTGGFGLRGGTGG